MLSQLRRLERLERVLMELQMYSSDCICFPKKEQPIFAWAVEFEIAMAVKCPLHGDRFKPELLVYMAKWEREKHFTILWSRRSEQYRKAWLASFPETQWPAEEEVHADGTTYLTLRDGTRLLGMPSFKQMQEIERPTNSERRRISQKSND